MSKQPLSIIINQQTNLPRSFNAKAFVKTLLKKLYLLTGHFEFTFVDKATIKALNIEYLDRDEFTDVISFNLGSQAYIEGDVYICVDVAKEQAETYEHTLDQELALLVIHGTLHLMGYEDEAPEQKAEMFAVQDKLFKELT